MTTWPNDGTVYVVITFASNGSISDLEVLDSYPKWDWAANGQQVRVANINGGDSSEL